VKAAIVTESGKAPTYGDFQEPTAKNGDCLINVTASALSHLTRGRASGSHYSASGNYPFVAGVDGVGYTNDGRRVYFVLPEAPFGGMAERTIAKAPHCIALPDGLDDVTAAPLANPGMSSWAALKERAGLRKGEAVLGVERIAQHRRGSDHIPGSGCGCTRRILQRAVFRRGCRCHPGLSVGRQRRKTPGRGSKNRQGRGAHPLHSNRNCQWIEYHIARSRASVNGHRAEGKRDRKHSTQASCYIDS